MARETDEGTWLTDPKLLEGLSKRLTREFASMDGETKAYLRAYYDRPVLGDDYTRPYRENGVYDSLKSSQSGNLTREVVDAAAALLCRELKAEVLPIGSDFKLDQGCKAASRLIEGVLDNSDFLAVATRAAIDGMSGAPVGPIKGYIDPATGEIAFENLDPLCFRWVDDGTDNPRTFLTETAVPRDQLYARYPQHKAKIKDLRKWSPPAVVGVDLPGRSTRDADTVRVVEAWARALGDNAPGRHSVVVGETVLEDEKWPHDVTPVFGFRWAADFRGYAGLSLARVLSKYDMANRRLMRIVYAGLAGAIPRLMVQEDSTVTGYSDQEWEVITYDTTKPSVEIPATVSPEVLAQIERNRELAFKESGINQNLATGATNPQYTSGAAQREAVDTANSRLLDKQKRWERLWNDAARVVVMLAQQAKTAHVRVAGANYYESVKFPNLPSDKYKVHFGLSNGLALTPAARLEELSDLQKMGLADTADVARQLGLPNTRALADRLNAPRDLVMKQISRALDDGRFEMPSSLQGDQLQSIVKVGGEEYQRAQLQGNYPAAHLEVLRRLIKAAQARLAPPAAPPMPANDQAPPAPAAPAPEPAPAAGQPLAAVA